VDVPGNRIGKKTRKEGNDTQVFTRFSMEPGRWPAIALRQNAVPGPPDGIRLGTQKCTDRRDALKTLMPSRLKVTPARTSKTTEPHYAPFVRARREIVTAVKQAWTIMADHSLVRGALDSVTGVRD
jgi:hypothetical protein